MSLPSSTTRTRLSRLAAVAGLALATALAGSAGAATLPLGTYTASLPVQPFPTVAGAEDPSGLGFPIRFTNTSSLGYLLTAVQVTVPAGFTLSGSPSVDAAGWTVSSSGGTVSASASDLVASGVGSGDSVVVTVHATAPNASGNHTFATAAQGIVADTGVATDFSNAGPEPVTEVHPYANVVTCAPGEICDTGAVGTDTDTTARIVTTTGASRDFVGISVQAPTDIACLALLQPQGRSQQITFGSADTSRTLTQTVRVDKAVVNEVPNNGAGKYTVCYNTQNSPSRTTFVDRDGNTVTAGLLPKCSGSLPVGNPCVVSIAKSSGGDLLVTFTAPGGDPVDIVGLPAVSSVSTN